MITGTKFSNSLQAPRSIFRHGANRAQYSVLDEKLMGLDEKLMGLGSSFNCDDHIRFHIRMKPDVNLCLFKKYTTVAECRSD